jgi:hypothetical protein
MRALTSTRLTSASRYLGICIIAIGLAACSNGGGGGGGNADPVYNAEACKTNPPEQGPSALTAKISQRNVVSADFFDKKYDRSMLEGVLDASSFSTTDYVKALGVNLSRITPATDKVTAQTCLNFYNLSSPDDGRQSIWNQVSQGLPQGNTLQGLYFEYCGTDINQPACQDRGLVQPTILVYEAADRWTIVHEMMHHNFNRERKLDLALPTEKELRGSITDSDKRLVDVLKAYNAAPDQAGALKIAAELDTNSHLIYDRLVRSSLEEIAVEGTLVEEYAAGTLKHVTSGSAKNAAWYMNYSKNGALDALKDSQNTARQVQAIAQRNNWTDASQKASQVLQNIAAISQDLSTKIASASEKVGYTPTPSYLTDSSEQMLITAAFVSIISRHLEHLDAAFTTPDVRLAEQELKVAMAEFEIANKLANQ